MRRAVILLAVMGTTLLLAGGVALAARIACDGGVCVGTPNSDKMRGTNRVDQMSGRGGMDRMYGLLRADIMRGGDNADTISAGYGKDRIYGQGSNDMIYGGPARDRIFGGPGRDFINAANGNDYVDVADGMVDSVSCGLGKEDTAVIDEADVGPRASIEDFVRQSSCENIERAPTME